jgi:hypothetical protein
VPGANRWFVPGCLKKVVGWLAFISEFCTPKIRYKEVIIFLVCVKI